MPLHARTTRGLQLIKQRARFAIRLSVALLLIRILTALVPAIVPWLVFRPSQAANPLYAYTYITYAFLTASILDWVRVSIILVLASQIVERYLVDLELLILVVGSALAGSVFFLIFLPGEAYIGTGAVGAGYMAAYFACWFPNRIHHGRWARVGAIFIAVTFLLELVSGRPLRLSIVLAGVVAGVCVFLWLRSRRPGRLEVHTADA